MKYHKIEVDEDILKYLKERAEPFVDTPNTVLRRLIFGESHRSQFKKKVLLNRISSTSATSKRKERDTVLESALKNSVGRLLEKDWGKFRFHGQSVLIFPDNEKRVVCKYSSCSDKEVRWFWGVSRKDWESWSDKDYLALVLEDQNRDDYSFLLLDASIARPLFGKCSISDGSKKINLGFYKNDNKPHLHEWPEFPISNHILDLPLVRAK